jgi:hypothetical protein
MDRRALIVSGLAIIGTAACTTTSNAQYSTRDGGNDGPRGRDDRVGRRDDRDGRRDDPDGPGGPPPSTGDRPEPGERGPLPNGARARPYTRDEMVNRVSDFMGVTAESAGAAIERVFRDYGQPTGYVAGEEASGAFAVGARYGRGLLYMHDRPTTDVYWQGPSIGFDVGGNASRVFTLCYNLQFPDAIFQRFPGVEGSAYLVAGLGVNYQRANGIVLAPIRAGVGLRLGANIGYLAYSRRRQILPF